jgi:hypothetical protein
VVLDSFGRNVRCLTLLALAGVARPPSRRTPAGARNLHRIGGIYESEVVMDASTLVGPVQDARPVAHAECCVCRSGFVGPSSVQLALDAGYIRDGDGWICSECIEKGKQP